MLLGTNHVFTTTNPKCYWGHIMRFNPTNKKCYWVRMTCWTLPIRNVPWLNHVFIPTDQNQIGIQCIENRLLKICARKCNWGQIMSSSVPIRNLTRDNSRVYHYQSEMLLGKIHLCITTINNVTGDKSCANLNASVIQCKGSNFFKPCARKCDC